MIRGFPEDAVGPVASTETPLSGNLLLAGGGRSAVLGLAEVLRSRLQ